ncbi:hypothetical protein V4C85_21955 [Ralstonia solanacearum]|uniref:Uncharacterized protein n=1 Tax=Ralstonia solanacearum TaxID=305 RepID=A0AA92E9N5_RALSL|nr:MULTISPECIES: hypothetical protein [Ralstonia solanacearum species complex]MDB0508218.1 hypothetical protein [Ralstonia solanacearum]QCX47889.1 hypothetical protein E7Z57_01490 [Ralstonia pseudosolanacearum]
MDRASQKHVLTIKGRPAQLVDLFEESLDQPVDRPVEHFSVRILQQVEARIGSIQIERIWFEVRESTTYPYSGVPVPTYPYC